jgi:hypothetical protein
MNTLLEAPAHETETAGRRHDDGGVVRKVNGSLSKPGRSELRWVKVTVRTAGSRRDGLELTHWKKVWQSMVED